MAARLAVGGWWARARRRWRDRPGALLLSLLLVAVIGCDTGPATPTGESIVDAFWTNVSASERTVTADFHMRLRAATPPDAGMLGGTVRGTVQMAGGDYHVSVAMEIDVAREIGIDRLPRPEPIRAEAIVVQGATFVHDHFAGEWYRDDGAGGMWNTMAYDVFSVITREDIEYAGQDDAPPDLHVITLRDADRAAERLLRPVGADPESGISVDDGSAVFEFFVDQDGLPVGALVRAAAQPRSATEAGYSLVIEYGFSNWGTPMVIVPPPVR